MKYIAPEDKPRVVVCAAMRKRHTDASLEIVTGPRHFDQTMHEQIRSSVNHLKAVEEVEQGFIDQYGTFMSREEAYGVAKAAGQIKYRCGGDEGQLFSENLY